jgi:hypothetical protein
LTVIALKAPSGARCAQHCMASASCVAWLLSSGSASHTMFRYTPRLSAPCACTQRQP